MAAFLWSFIAMKLLETKVHCGRSCEKKLALSTALRAPFHVGQRRDSSGGSYAVHGCCSLGGVEGIWWLELTQQTLKENAQTPMVEGVLALIVSQCHRLAKWRRGELNPRPEIPWKEPLRV